MFLWHWWEVGGFPPEVYLSSHHSILCQSKACVCFFFILRTYKSGDFWICSYKIRYYLISGFKLAANWLLLGADLQSAIYSCIVQQVWLIIRKTFQTIFWFGV